MKRNEWIFIATAKDLLQAARNKAHYLAGASLIQRECHEL